MSGTGRASSAPGTMGVLLAASVLRLVRSTGDGEGPVTRPVGTFDPQAATRGQSFAAPADAVVGTGGAGGRRPGTGTIVPGARSRTRAEMG